MTIPGPRLDEHDFERLATTSMQWANHGWEEQDGRFSTTRVGEFVRYDLPYVFWFESVAASLLAREFLRQQGAQFQELYDQAELRCGGCDHTVDHDPYVLITDYETEVWKDTRERRPKCPHH